MRAWWMTTRAVSRRADLRLSWASPSLEKGRSGRFAALHIGEGVDEGFSALCNCRVQCFEFFFFFGIWLGVFWI